MSTSNSYISMYQKYFDENEILLKDNNNLEGKYETKNYISSLTMQKTYFIQNIIYYLFLLYYLLFFGYLVIVFYGFKWDNWMWKFSKILFFCFLPQLFQILAIIISYYFSKLFLNADSVLY